MHEHQYEDVVGSLFYDVILENMNQLALGIVYITSITQKGLDGFQLALYPVIVLQITKSFFLIVRGLWQGRRPVMPEGRVEVRRGSMEGERGREEIKGNPLGVMVPLEVIDRGGDGVKVAADKGEGCSSVVPVDAPVDGSGGDGDDNDRL
jgi:hypothetical protein